MSNFAVITHYNDIKKAIEDKPEFVFKYEEETNTYVVKYNLLLAGSFDHEDENVRKLLLEARGITFDADTGEVVSRKFHKFFNIGEKPSSQIGNIDFSKRHWIMQKLDGCCDENTTLITMEGEKTIKEICDEKYKGCVYGYNHNTKTIEWTPIIDHSVKDNNNNWYEIELENGKSIKLTGNHKVWCENLNEYVRVDELSGDENVIFDE